MECERRYSAGHRRQEDPVPAWSPPGDWLRVRTVDLHTAGEPLRLILDGVPQPEGTTVLVRRRYARRHQDHLRRFLMHEPRGHRDMYGCLLMSPVRPNAHAAVLFLHNAGFSTMCGHGIIAAATALVELGLLETEAATVDGIPVAVRFDTPAGPVDAEVDLTDDGHARFVRFRNVPSFVARRGVTVEVERLGAVTCDVAYGGAFYAFVDADAAGIPLDADAVPELVRLGRSITPAVAASAQVTHPSEPDLAFLYGTVFTGASSADGVHSRHVCVFADGEVDRSPTGTAVSARLALLDEDEGELADHELWFESVIGSRFSGRVVDRIIVEGRDAIVPEVGGRAFITGRHEFLLDPEDPWPAGFILG